MKTFRKYINGNGYLTDDGKELFRKFEIEMDHLLSNFEKASEQEAILLGSVMAKSLGDKIASFRKEIRNRLSETTFHGDETNQ
jgi:hypothetical protein